MPDVNFAGYSQSPGGYYSPAEETVEEEEDGEQAVERR